MVSKATQWPNGLGWNVRQSRILFEVFADGRITRMAPDNSLCGYRGVKWCKVSFLATDSQSAINAVVHARQYGDWQPCED